MMTEKLLNMFDYVTAVNHPDELTIEAFIIDCSLIVGDIEIFDGMKMGPERLELVSVTMSGALKMAIGVCWLAWESAWFKATRIENQDRDGVRKTAHAAKEDMERRVIELAMQHFKPEGWAHVRLS